MSIRAVIFDLDHTLYNFMDCHEAANGAIRGYTKAHFGLTAEESDARIVQAMADTADKVGHDNPATHSRTLRYQTFAETLGVSAIAHAHIMADLYWDTFYAHMLLLPVVAEVLTRIRQAGRRILIATDMQADVQIRKLQRLSIVPLVDYLVTSEEADSEKPGKGILELCVKKAGCAPKECVFVGDHPIKDVLGPIAYGMHGAWCRAFDPERFMAAFRISIDDATLAKVTHRFARYEDCLLPDGGVDFGGITVA